MRTIRWADGTRFGDVNARWGSPSYVLQPGDQGFTAPNLSPYQAMSDKRKFSFPLSTLLHAAKSLDAALDDLDYAAAMAARLDDPTATPPIIFRTLLETALAEVRAQVEKQVGKTGDAGQLTSEQEKAYAEVERLSAAARRSARLAFPDDEVRLRSEFQVGIHQPQDQGSILARAEKTHTAAVKYAADLRRQGWLPTDADELATALAAFSGVILDQDEALADRVQFTADLTRAANTLYKLCQACQNAARLQYPGTQPGQEAARARFLLETFPPRDRTPAEPPAPPAPAAG